MVELWLGWGFDKTRVLKNFGSNKIGRKKIWVKKTLVKKFLVKRIFRSNFFLSKHISLVPKYFLVQKNFWGKKILGQKNFGYKLG